MGGRLSKEDVEAMTRDAEKYKKEDEMWKEKVESKNGLEQFAYQMKGQVEDEKIKEKLDDSDVETVKKACQDCLDWSYSNQMAERRSSSTSVRSSRAFATLSSPRCMVVHQVACLEVCQVACLEVCQVVVPLLVAELVGLILRKLIKRPLYRNKVNM